VVVTSQDSLPELKICCILQHPLVPASVAHTQQQRSSSVAVTVARRQLVSSVNNAAGLSVCSYSSSARRVRHSPGVSQSVQSDNSFDAEYCDVEPDSSPGSVTNEDVADLSGSTICVSSSVSDCRRDLFSSSHRDHTSSASVTQTTETAETSAPAMVTVDGARHTSLRMFSSVTAADLLPKSTFPVTWEKLLSPVKHNTDVFNPILPPLTTDSLTDYSAPVMAAESSTRCVRFLPATAAALCDTSTVSSPSFARAICAAISTVARHPQLDSAVNESSACSTSVPGLVTGLVVTSSTPVMADVLQAQLDQGSIHQLSAAGLPVMRTARLTDHGELVNAILSQTQLGISRTEASAGATGRQQALPNDLTVPVIAFLNLGAGTGSLPSLSCAAVLPPGSLQLLKLSVSSESAISSLAGGTDQARLL